MENSSTEQRGHSFRFCYLTPRYAPQVHGRTHLKGATHHVQKRVCRGAWSLSTAALVGLQLVEELLLCHALSSSYHYNNKWHSLQTKIKMNILNVQASVIIEGICGRIFYFFDKNSIATLWWICITSRTTMTWESCPEEDFLSPMYTSGNLITLGQEVQIHWFILAYTSLGHRMSISHVRQKELIWEYNRSLYTVEKRNRFPWRDFFWMSWLQRKWKSTVLAGSGGCVRSVGIVPYPTRAVSWYCSLIVQRGFVQIEEAAFCKMY